MNNQSRLNQRALKAMVAACLFAGSNLFSAGSTQMQAKWIWLKGGDVHAYNQTIVAEKKFKLDKPQQATLRITADSYYRLFINDHWVNDGPARSWPEHFQYDVLDATPYLVDGANEIRVVAIHYGVGDFHRVPQQAGLLAQLDVQLACGKTRTLITDGSWQVAALPALVPHTPKISIQMSPAELYDARLAGKLAFKRAAVLFEAEHGPWKDLNPRDVALLTKQPFAFKSLQEAKIVQGDGLEFLRARRAVGQPGRDRGQSLSQLRLRHGNRAGDSRGGDVHAANGGHEGGH